jgi:glycosyltransferase involved in cell wall biosynthesis
MAIVMKVLILSFYYPPDIGPGALRAISIAEALSETGNCEVEVWTTVPNRYKSFHVDTNAFENKKHITVHRIKLPNHKNGKFDQAKAFIVYAKNIYNLSHNQNFDMIIATSSRLMTASLAALISRKIRSKLYLDIRDLFTDTLENLLQNNVLRILLPIFRILERWTFSQADKISIVSEGFVPYMKDILPNAKLNVFTNGIDNEFLSFDFSNTKPEGLPLILYAGNIGDGQGLHKIIPKTAKALTGIARFRIIGSGGREKELKDMLLYYEVSNVEIINPIPRNELMLHYKQADILFLHLNSFPAFEKVLPSKIFEYGAINKPIIAGVDGYAADFLKREIPSSKIFKPCDVESMLGLLDELQNNNKQPDNKKFCKLYARKAIINEMVKEIINMD